MSARTTWVYATFVLLAAAMAGCGGGKSRGAAPPPVDRPAGSHFGVHLGSLDYAGALDHIAALGNQVYVRNEVFRDAYGWRYVKTAALAESCLACCDPARSPCTCNVGDFYYCEPASRDGLRETPVLSDFYRDGFNQLVTLYASRYDDAVPTTQEDLIAAYPTGHEDLYRGYIDFVVNSFDPRIRYWEIGNENDLAQFWSGSATDYANMLALASGVIRAACDSCRVGASFSGPGVASSWLSVLGAVASHLDYLDIHHTDASFIQEGDLDRWKTACPGKEFISTETGVPDAPGFGGDAGGSLDAQARDLVKLNTMMFAEGYNRIFWYLIDTDYGAGSIFLHNALIDESGSRKPAFTAYATMIDQVDFFTSVTRLGSGAYRYDFAGGQPPVYVLWCEAGTCSPPAAITGQVRVTDYLGTTSTRQVAGLVITSSPVYVEEL